MNIKTKIYVDPNTDQSESLLTGYKGSEMQEASVYFCLYIPHVPSTPPWEALLDTLHVNHTLEISKNKTSQNHIMDAIAIMQERFPGNYTIEETYNPTHMKFEYVMVFDNKEEKAIFVLKNS